MEAFWKHKTLEEMSRQEWESLCDGCALCCLHKMQDEDTDEVFFTDIACRLLDLDTCRCTDYARRSTNVPDCVKVTLKVLEDPYWLPRTCAYRLLAEGKDLPWWHPLVSGDPDTVIQSGNTVRGRVISELEADDLEQHMVDWFC